MCFEIEACSYCGTIIPYEEYDRHLQTHIIPAKPLEEPIPVTVTTRKKTRT